MAAMLKQCWPKRCAEITAVPRNAAPKPRLTSLRPHRPLRVVLTIEGRWLAPLSVLITRTRSTRLLRFNAEVSRSRDVFTTRPLSFKNIMAKSQI